ncbi:MAG: family 16 glycosylhydrolase [Planctomycetota bacterium]
MNERSSPLDLSDWKLEWQDEFDYPNARLDENWESQNGPSGHILCSRWRENAVVKNGILHLVNRKESRGGQEWTSGSIWTKKKFKYGYFECRYRYAEATGTNNSFWLMTHGTEPSVGKKFEIDINEGHYPNEVNTNIHNWTDVVTRADGTRTHPSSHKGFAFGTRPDYSLPLEIPVKARRLRLTSTTNTHFHIREFRILAPRKSYPSALSEPSARQMKRQVDHARSPAVSITASGGYNEVTKPKHAADGTLQTSWISPSDGKKWLEFKWPKPVTVGCIQFINGWKQDGEWTGHGQVSDYKISVHDEQKWSDIAAMDSKDETDFGAHYHTYALQWTEKEIVFYQDRKEVRRVANKFCHSETPIWLSEAIIPWGGAVSNAIDGTSMKVDWVRYYQKK